MTIKSIRFQMIALVTHLALFLSVKAEIQLTNPSGEILRASFSPSVSFTLTEAVTLESSFNILLEDVYQADASATVKTADFSEFTVLVNGATPIAIQDSGTMAISAFLGDKRRIVMTPSLESMTSYSLSVGDVLTFSGMVESDQGPSLQFPDNIDQSRNVSILADFPRRTVAAESIAISSATQAQVLRFNFGNNDAGVGWNNITATQFNSGNAQALIDAVGQATQVTFKGTGNLSPSIQAFDPAIVALQNDALWNGGSAKDWITPAAAQDYLLFSSGNSFEQYVFALDGLNPSSRYKVEILSAMEKSDQGMIYVIPQVWNDTQFLRPDRNFNGTTGQSSSSQIGSGTSDDLDFDTQTHGWNGSNWVIYDGAPSGFSGANPFGIASGNDVMVIILSKGGTLGLNAVQLTDLGAPTLELERPGDCTAIAQGSTISFGSVAPLEVKKIQVLITNPNPYQVRGITISFAGDSRFSGSILGSSTLAPGESRLAELRYQPQEESGHSSTFTLQTSDDGPIFIGNLTGNGASPAAQITAESAAAGLTGSDAAPTAMPFDDGVSNLAKYAFNMNLGGADASQLTLGSGNSGLPVAVLDESGETPVLRLEFIRRKGAGLIYSPQRTNTLGSYDPMTGAVMVVDIDDNFERVIINEPCDPAVDISCFSRVRVELPSD